jgi:16S rRNA processing protein RimM
MSADPHRLVRIGRVSKAHGIHGEVSIRPDVPDSTTLLTQKGAWLKPRVGAAEFVEIDSARTAHEAILVRFKACADRTAAEALCGREVLLSRECLPEPDAGEFYAADLVGLAVQSEDGRALGVVFQAVETGGVPVLEIKKGEQSFQVPLADTFVKRIDIEAGVIVIVEPEPEEE